MRPITLPTVFIILLTSVSAFAQNEVELRTDGIVVPRTTASAVVNPTEGMMIYDTDTNDFRYFNGANWIGFSTGMNPFERVNSLVRPTQDHLVDDLIFGSIHLPFDTLVSDTALLFDVSKGGFRVGGYDSRFQNWHSDRIGSFSFTSGFNSVASGNFGASAMGFNSQATGITGATALGSFTRAAGDQGATAFGTRTSASGNVGATALGSSTIASGDQGATALGHVTEASGNTGAFAAGYESKAEGDNGATALGEVAVAEGHNGATAIGNFTSATGNFGATAMGSRTLASGNMGATAIGYYAESKGNYGAIAIGDSTTVEGDYGSFALGRLSVSLGHYGSSAIGDETQVTGDHGGMAMGYKTNSSGSFGSIAIGANAEVKGNNGSLAAGYRTTTKGDNGAATMGYFTQSNGNSCLVVGQFNDTLVSPQQSVTTTSPLFIVGNGTALDTRSNALVVKKNGQVSFLNYNFPIDAGDAGQALRTDGSGQLEWKDDSWLSLAGNLSYSAGNVGINESNPVAQLTIKQSTTGDNSGLRLVSNEDAAAWEIRNTASTDNLRIRAFAADGSLDHTVEISRTDGAYLQNSDLRLKENIKPMNEQLSKILEIQPHTYYWKNAKTDQPSIGVIAQELEKIFPQAVATNEEGYKMVNYDILGVLAIEAIKEQQNQINQLKKEIKTIKNMLLSND